MPSVPACLRCHKAGGGAVPFLFAGTVFADHAATRGAADVEVRVVDGSGTATSVHSDANGNFWVKGTGSLGKAHAGGRSASSVRTMRAPVSNGDCNHCHTTETPFVLESGP